MKKIDYLFRAVLAILFLVVGNIVVTAAPNLPQRCSVFRPAILKKRIIKESQLEELTMRTKKKAPSYGQKGISTNEYWYVYSDRSDNTTYEEPDSESKKFGTLDFNEQVIIASIVSKGENDYALVYTEPKSQIYPAISRAAKCRGWVPMSKLLLWSDCPANDHDILNKAIIVGNINRLNKDEETTGYYYKNPEILDKNREALKSVMKFYFVMKKDPKTGMHLLAEYSRVGGRVQNALFGWVSPGMYAPWSERTCLEPNWKLDVLVNQNLKGTNIPVGDLILNDSKNKKRSRYTGIKAHTHIELGKKRNNVTNDDRVAYRLDPRTLRYPLLENLEKDGKDPFFKITAFASIGGADASVDAGSGAMDKIQKLLDDMKVINLIFVIDGTAGMGKYFTAVTNILNREYFKRDNRKVKIGLVIYRDPNAGKNATEYLPMRDPNDATLRRWLNKGGEYGLKGKSEYRSVLEALKLALDAGKMGYSRDQSNLMFVIGDCGNNPNGMNTSTQEEIANRCVQNRIQLSSFNVRNLDKAPYQLFRKQLARIVMKNMETQYAQLGDVAKHEYVQTADGYDFKPGINPETTLFIGSFRNAASGKEMSDNQLYSYIYSTSQRIDEAINRQEKIMSNAEKTITGKNGNSSMERNTAASSIDMEYIQNRLSKADINAIKQSGLLMAFEGYTPIKSDSNLDFWQPVIYISHPELLNLLSKLKHVVDEADQDSDDRGAYVQAMKQLAATIVGDVSESALGEMKNEDIMNMLTGLTVKTNALNFSLNDIQSKKKVTPQQFKELTSTFVEQYKKLDGIRSLNYPFSYKDRNGEKWYWIPTEFLP